jgi:hypothetical protein
MHTFAILLLTALVLVYFFALPEGYSTNQVSHIELNDVYRAYLPGTSKCVWHAWFVVHHTDGSNSGPTYRQIPANPANMRTYLPCEAYNRDLVKRKAVDLVKHVYALDDTQLRFAATWLM